MDGQSRKTSSDLVSLERCQEDPALSLLTGTTCATETMNVGVAFSGKTNLEDVSNVREVHSSSSDIGGKQDSRVGMTEAICCLCTRTLTKLGMYLVSGKAVEGLVTLEPPGELEEN